MADRVLSIGIALLGILAVGLGVYALGSGYEHVTMNIQVGLSIQLISRNGGNISRITPAANIGLQGGVMHTTRYLQDGVAGNYPLYTADKMGIIYVRSQVARNYTIGDFFEVWGNSLGPANTLGLQENFTSAGVVDFFWEMCIKNSQNQVIPTFEWGSHVLKGGEVIELAYSVVGCSG